MLDSHMTSRTPLLLASTDTSFGGFSPIREIMVHGTLITRPLIVLNNDEHQSIHQHIINRPNLKGAECTLRIRVDVDGFLDEPEYQAALEHLKKHPDQYSPDFSPDLAYATLFTPVNKRWLVRSTVSTEVFSNMVMQVLDQERPLCALLPLPHQAQWFPAYFDAFTYGRTLVSRVEPILIDPMASSSRSPSFP